MGKATLGVGDRNTSVHRAEVRYEEGISYSAEDIEGACGLQQAIYDMLLHKDDSVRDTRRQPRI